MRGDIERLAERFDGGRREEGYVGYFGGRPECVGGAEGEGDEGFATLEWGSWGAMALFKATFVLDTPNK